MSVVINLFGAPGAGKSTLAAHTFSLLKTSKDKYNVELVTEFAKQLTWQERYIELKCQPYIFGKQLNRMWHLLNKVDVIITDSPLLLTLLYNSNHWPASFKNFVIDTFYMFGNINFLVNRVKEYNPIGRNQSVSESDSIHKDLRNLLLDINVDYTEIDGVLSSSDIILNKIKEVIHNDKKIVVACNSFDG